MDVKKINEALSDIVSLASSGMLTDDVKIKEQAIADIVDKIRSVMPELFQPSAPAAAPTAETEPETATTVGCPSLRPMPINLPSGFDGVEPSSEELENA